MRPRVSASSRLVLVSAAIALTLVVLAGVSHGPTTSTADRVSATLAPATSIAPQPGTPAIGSPNASPSVLASAASSILLVTLIGQLPQAAEHRNGYSRDLFRHWIDADGDGCDTRGEVLIDEAVMAPRIGSGCRLPGGQWISPYDGVVVTYASKLDIDHLVPLAEAWDSGAYAWDPQRREAFANDLGVPWALFAVTASSNRSKGDQDPAEWLPPLRSDRCEYIVDWVAVKVRWGLTVDPVERAALLDDATGCKQTPIPSIPRT